MTPNSSSLAMRRYSIEPRKRKYFKEYVFLSFAIKCKKQLYDTELDVVKTASKNQMDFWKQNC